MLGFDLKFKVHKYDIIRYIILLYRIIIILKTLLQT